jgi:hypothetical protein
MMTPRDKAKINEIHERIAAVDQSRRERANDLARRAGLDEARNVWHNAILSLQCGTPWRGVDYSLLRAAIRVEESRLDVSRLRSRLVSAVLARCYPGFRDGITGEMHPERAA